MARKKEMPILQKRASSRMNSSLLDGSSDITLDESRLGSSRRRSSRMAERPVTDDANDKTENHTAARFLSEVSIPIKSVECRKLPARKEMTANSTRLSSDPPTMRSVSATSASSNVGDLSSNYETPGTSTVATPAEYVSSKVVVASTGVKSGGKSRITTAMRARQLRESKWSLSSGMSKRKRETDDEDDESDGDIDTRLARRLQAEEYQVQVAESGKRSRRTPATSLATSKDLQVDESSDGSDLSSVLSSARSLSVGVENVTPARSGHVSGRLPGRAARDSAKKSISAASQKQVRIEDSDAENMDFTEPDSDYVDPMVLITSADEEQASDAREGQEVTRAQHRKLKTDATSMPPRHLGVSSTANAARSTSRASAVVQARATRRARGPRMPRYLSRAERERLRLEHYHPEVMTMWEELAAQEIIRPVEAKQPESITRQLKSFQLQGLDWMVKQEKTKWKGGLLGDEMGMGKTIQAVSLIMSDYPAKNPTLVVVPPVALMQWQNEIGEYTNGKLKVLLFHGTRAKKLTMTELKKYDVLMTSYSTLEATHRKERKGWSRMDSDDEKVLVKEDSPLHAIHFHRIILDEAHSIKSRNSGTAKACYALHADYRWCLSGTPLQNRIGEFFSLFRFLGVQPFACYMCKACTCKEVHWALDPKTRMCKVCKHRGFDHVSLFNLELLDPIVNNGHQREGKVAYDKLQILTARIMLRRLKADHTASMELPPKHVVVHNEFFGEIERDFASSIMTNTNRQFDTYVAQGVMLNNYANIFGLIMQMRQVADHPDMILRKHAEGGQNVLVCAVCDDAAEDAIRSACRHDFCRACVKSYMKGFSQNDEDPDCPRCHIPLSIDLEQEEREQDEQAVKKSSIINRIKMDKWTSSTKIEMLIFELAQMRTPKRTTKSIVFSQFTSMLQLVEWRLRRAGFNTVMLDGTMTPTQRQSSIDFFMKNPDVEVFLVSLKAGGVALNLTEASKVYIIDPWWNPAAEWQSADRCHRIGQGRPCSITRLVIEDSVESRMVLLQEKKARMIQGTINADESAMQNLAPEDMQFLFRGA